MRPADILNTTGLIDELRGVFIVIVAVLACVALWAGIKGKLGNALSIVAVILAGAFVWGLVALFQSGAAATLTAKLVTAIVG